MHNKKVPGFTIMEVTIAMLLSAIVIGLTYTVFSLVTRSYQSYQSRHREMATVLSLDGLLRRDFDRAELILKDTDGIVLANQNNLIKYRFYPDYVLRKGTAIDTFRLKTDSIAMSFEGKTIDSSGTRAEDNQLDELSLQITLQKEKIPYYYHKIYSSANLINRKTNAGN